MAANLTGITWNHSRGYVPMVASALRFTELNPNIGITWKKRSLQEFADEPLDKLADDFDLLVIDHPWVGFVAEWKLLLPLVTCLPAEFLHDQAENSVGKSFQSYAFKGHQWAVAIDAATPVASSRPDLMEQQDIELPQTFQDLLELAARGLVIMPGIPLDSLMNFYMLCSA